jgi:Ca2+:H+ antiporter
MTERSDMTTLLRREWFLGVSVGSCLLALAQGPALRESFTQPVWLLLVLAWLFAVVLGSAVAVVRHAERLAELMGEPYGTLILTLSVTSIEVVSIASVMAHGDNNPTLARETLFAVTMIVLNGMVGLSLLLGAWRHREQQYNLQGANAYLSVIIPLAVLSMVMPDFETGLRDAPLSTAQQIFLVGISVGLYSAFLALQMNRHRGFFLLGGEPDFARGGKPVAVVAAAQPDSSLAREPRARILDITAVRSHALLLAAYMVPVVILARELAAPIDYLIETLHMSNAVGGVMIAVLVATPEALGAVRAALANQLQRSMNIFLGSVLSTIGLTVPAIVIIGAWTGAGIELGLHHTDLVMLLLTLAVSVVTFASGRTNILQGLVHLVLFAAYLFLMVQG